MRVPLIVPALYRPAHSGAKPKNRQPAFHLIRYTSCMPTLRSVLGLLADLAYPTACAHCNTFCDGSTGGPLCPDCAGKLHDMSMAAACTHCAAPLGYADAPCPRCLGKGFHPYERVGRLCIYADPVKTLIKQFKYHRRWPLGEWLTDRLLEQPRITNLLKDIDVIIPVPLHRNRQFSRGYNQAKVIAAHIAKRCKRGGSASADVKV